MLLGGGVNEEISPLILKFTPARLAIFLRRSPLSSFDCGALTNNDNLPKSNPNLQRYYTHSTPICLLVTTKHLTLTLTS